MTGPALTGPALTGPAVTEQLELAVHAAGRSTGHQLVDAALQATAQAAQLPPAEQVAAFESLHRTLQETLATIEQV